MQSALSKVVADIPLQNAGINGGNIFACMASSVERSSAIICFMTERYETSENGERELTYAGSKKVTIIPCLVQDTREQRGCQYKPEGRYWVGNKEKASKLIL